MKDPRAPRIDERRSLQFLKELEGRARAWMPEWGVGDDPRDFGRALLGIAARFNAEVAERLDRVGEKMQRGFLDWLAVARQAARPARAPVVFRLAESATEAVDAPASLRLQADVAGASVVFETEAAIRLCPGRLDAVVAVDADVDAFYFAPPDVLDLSPPEPLPTRWMTKSTAPKDLTRIQLDPEAGLKAGMMIEAGGNPYRIEAVDKDLVTISPPLTATLEAGSPVTRIAVFDPFKASGAVKAINDQEHILYIGDDELLNLESRAVIQINGVNSLPEGVEWKYWGRSKEPDDAGQTSESQAVKTSGTQAGWQPLTATPNGANLLCLTKAAGAMELREIEGRTSRWIRARVDSLKTPSSEFSATSLQLRINPRDDSQDKSTPCCPTISIAEKEEPVVEAMANSTPLVVDEVFYPLGREPRLFDAFYIGCSEAFSKKDAVADVTLEVSSSTCESLSAVKVGGELPYLLAGVGKNLALQLIDFVPTAQDALRFRGLPLSPPTPTEAGSTAASTEKLNLACRPVMWLEANKVTVSILVASGNQIWRRLENIVETETSEWIKHSIVTPIDGSTPTVEDLVPGPTGQELLAALADGQLFVYTPHEDQRGTWDDRTPEDPAGIRFTSITPVVDAAGSPMGGRLIAVSRNGGLYLLEPGDAAADRWKAKPLQNDGVVDETAAPHPLSAPNEDEKFPIHPAAIQVDDVLMVVAVAKLRGALIALKADVNRLDDLPPQLDRVSLVDSQVIGAAVAMVKEADGVRAFVCLQQASTNFQIGSWAPSFPASGSEPPSAVLRSDLPITTGSGGGTPLVIEGSIIVPGPREDAYLTVWRASEAFRKVISEGIVFPPNARKPEEGKFLAALFDDSGQEKSKGWEVEESFDSSDERRLYPIPPTFEIRAARDPQVSAFLHDPKPGTVKTKKSFTVAEDPHPRGSGDPGIEKKDIIRIKLHGMGDDLFSQVTGIRHAKPEKPTGEDEGDQGGTPSEPESWTITIKDEILPAEGGALEYWEPTSDFGGAALEIKPMIRFEGSDAEALRRVPNLARAFIDFTVDSPATTPAPPKQHFSLFFVDATTNLPKAIALGTRWTSAHPLPGREASFRMESILQGDWRRHLGPTATNPELSWEYWNGRGWWSLKVKDDTARLATTGIVQFTVPTDIAETDWAGKANYWIRARLIGGDYGRETVTVTTKNVTGGTEQTVDRRVDGIRAPQILGMHVSYRLNKARHPTWVVTRDSGTLRDQSDANRAEKAIIEAFVPIAEMEGRFTAAGAGSAVSPTSPEAGRSLYLGLSAGPSGGPVRVLLLVDQERFDDGGSTALEVEALAADQFVKVVAVDESRALGESGGLTMFFNVAPTRRELFGRELSWLRLHLGPASPVKTWTPTLRGAYLNGVWASARETLTRERLGSSDGSPSLTVRLARPPVLRDSLELRVREPLGEEERRALVDADPKAVRSDVEGLPGDWVLWKQAVDPSDEPASARVYALDEATGEVRFGDGVHGRIPPIGVDSIVAFSYSRTEADPGGDESVPGNRVEARTTLNLASPVESVESVVAADQAAGGAPPDSDDRVLLFGSSRLRHRGRGVTSRDVEDLILQSSPDIVQIRALERPGSLRVVVVRRGADPTPSVAQIRELKRLVQGVGPAALEASGALEIVGPRIRRLRIHLRLVVEDLDFAGSLVSQVVERLVRFFDAASGGPEGIGWAPGVNVADAEVAVAIIDVPHLLSVEDVKLHEVGPDGTPRTWPESLNPDEIPRLADDPISCEVNLPHPQASS